MFFASVLSGTEMITSNLQIVFEEFDSGNNGNVKVFLMKIRPKMAVINVDVIFHCPFKSSVLHIVGVSVNLLFVWMELFGVSYPRLYHSFQVHFTSVL